MVLVVAKKDHDPAGCEEKMDTGNRSTLISWLSSVTVTVAPPHGAFGSFSSSNPAVGGQLSVKWADVRVAAIRPTMRERTILMMLLSTCCRCEMCKA